MLKTFLKEVVALIVGKQAEDIVDMLDGSKYVNEFIIAKKLGITINQTRNILYKISDYGLISSIRKKDKRKGWYTYFWKAEILKSLEFLENMISKKLEQLRNKLKSRETKEFYVCEQCNVEFNAENALLHEFTCKECGNVYTLKDNSKLIKELKKEIGKLEEKLKLVNDEINIEREKLDKKRAKEIKKDAEEKARKKAVAAAKRKAAKKRLERKERKKISKKSVKKIIAKRVVKKKAASKKPIKKSSAKKSLKKKITRKKPVRKIKSSKKKR